MSAKLTDFVDILSERKLQNEDSFFMSHVYNPPVSYKQTRYLNPDELKRLVLNSSEINQIIEEISEERSVEKIKLRHDASAILEEMALDRRLVVIRVLGVAISKLLKQCCSGLLVDRPSIQKVKNDMGSCPVLLLPSHRSYADFVLMAFVTFCEDFQVPAVAAGMDFHGMLGMGAVLRQTGAFFMRRTLSGADPLYKALFRRYVHALVQEHHTPLEFFIEGTRSRTAKALSPKTGLLGMALEPFIFGRVPDITIVPVSISYDRVLEEELFAYELLGVPKPKETTKGLFHSLQRLNERYGAMRFRFGEAISTKDFMADRLDRAAHRNVPAYMQCITTQEMGLVQELAHEILQRQQQGIVIGTFNITAMVLYWYYWRGAHNPTMKELEHCVLTWTKILESMGSLLSKQTIIEALNVHKKTVTVNKNGKVNLMMTDITLMRKPENKLKGHNLDDKTMTMAIPIVKLQIYINPLLFYLCGPAFILAALKVKRSISKDDLFKDVSMLLDIFSFEFVFQKSKEVHNMNKWLRDLTNMKAIYEKANSIKITDNDNVDILISLMTPFLYCYITVFEVLSKITTEISENIIFVETQKYIEVDLFKAENKNLSVLCYSLSLDAISNAINSLTSLGCLHKSRRNSTTFYRRIDNHFCEWQTFLNNFCIIYTAPILAGKSKL